MQGFEAGESRSRDELVIEVERLERELARSREDAQRMRTLFNSMATYAQKARGGSERDGDDTQHEDESDAERLATATSDLERTERELDRARQELERLRTLTAETRTRLSTFVTAGLESLATEPAAVASPARDLDEAQGEWLPSPSTHAHNGTT